MKQLTGLIMLVLLSSGFLLAQEIDHEFGAVSLDELKMENYEKDAGAEAVVLYDIGLSRFQRVENGFDVVFERKTRIKIFDKPGYRWAEISIPFYREGHIFEKITELEGYTYTLENGGMTKTPLNLKNAFDEKVNESWNIKKFTMPNVNEGSVIEFRYKLISPYKFNLRDWEFQSQIPTIYSEYTVKMIPFYEYTYLFQGASRFDHHKSYVEKGLSRRFGSAEYQDMVYEFAMKDVPAFQDEEYITSVNDYIMKIDFQLSQVHQLNGVTTEIITTWPKLCAELTSHSDFGKFIKGSEKKSGKLPNLPDLSQTNDIEKTEALVDYLKTNYTWNGVNSKYAHKKVNDFLKEKTGASAEINLFLTGLLRAFDIEAFPVLISTRGNGKIKVDYPFSHFFNYVIVLAQLESGMLLLDGTDKLCPFNLLPTKCKNERGLIVDKDGGNWVELTDALPSIIQEDLRITLPESGVSEWRCTMDMKLTGYDALNMRKKISDNPERLEEYFSENGFIKFDSLRTTNFDEAYKPYALSFEASAAAEQIGDNIYISPFLNRAISENPFKVESRSYPIDMIYARKRVYNSEIIIPEDYIVEHMPENYEFTNGMIDIKFKILKADENTIRVSGAYHFKKPVYEAADYGKIKYFYNQIIKRFNDKITLVKKT